MNRFLSRHKCFSWKVFWKMVSSPLETVNQIIQQNKDLLRISGGCRSFSIGEHVYIRKDLYEIDPVPIVKVYDAMKGKEKNFIRSANLLTMWSAIKEAVEK